MPSLLLGPMLRHVGTDDATVWMETDRACTAEVLGHRAETFCVDGHHFAMLVVGGLEPGTTTPYEVLLDGRRAWPPDDPALPAPVIRTVAAGVEIEIVFGSCRTSVPHEPPYLQTGGHTERAHGIDALHALARRMADDPPERWPDFLLMLGDQIYADQLSPAMREVAAVRAADGSSPEELCDFSEYALAYREAWGDPLLRWLFSVLPSSMIFDDHEIHAEWKISQAWLDEMRSTGWYERRIVGGLASYWVYQHLGNLSPAELDENLTFRRVRDADDAAGILRDLATGADRQAGHSRWSFCRDLGRSRLVVVDSRAGRELGSGGRRMIDDLEWEWIAGRAEGDYDHLLLGSSLPFFLVRGLHDFEAWNEAVCDGAWGRRFARVGERIRRAAVLDHWANFARSFDRLARLLEHLAAGGDSGRPPRSIILLSGDVHHCYLAEVDLPGDATRRAPVWQAVCSPYRKRLRRRERALMRFGASAVGAAIGWALARAARLPPRSIGWRVVEPPSYDNQLGRLTIGPEAARLRVETTVGSTWREPALHPRFERRLA